MPKKATGTIESHPLADGTRAFHLRVRVHGERERIVLHERPGCVCGCGGGWDEPGARTEMGNILARVRAGVCERPAPPPPVVAAETQDEVPPYDEYADWWLQAKVNGIIGEKPRRLRPELIYAIGAAAASPR